jgi:hypothetical protein
MPQAAPLSMLILRFAGLSLGFAALYALGTDYYAQLVVNTADLLTSLVLPVTIETHPHGFVVYSPEAKQPMGVPYRLTVIGLNIIFAPALVLTTLGVSLSAVARTLISLLVMVFLHGVEVTSIILYQASHPDNAAFALHFSDAALTVVQFFYRFLDRMAYALFPFLAWAIACPETIASFFQSRTSS